MERERDGLSKCNCENVNYYGDDDGKKLWMFERGALGLNFTLLLLINFVLLFTINFLFIKYIKHNI